MRPGDKLHHVVPKAVKGYTEHRRTRGEIEYQNGAISSSASAPSTGSPRRWYICCALALYGYGVGGIAGTWNCRAA